MTLFLQIHSIQQAPLYLPFYDNGLIIDNGKEMNVDCGAREVLVQKCIPHNPLVPRNCPKIRDLQEIVIRGCSQIWVS